MRLNYHVFCVVISQLDTTVPHSQQLLAHRVFHCLPRILLSDTRASSRPSTVAPLDEQFPTDAFMGLGHRHRQKEICIGIVDVRPRSSASADGPEARTNRRNVGLKGHPKLHSVHLGVVMRGFRRITQRHNLKRSAVWTAHVLILFWFRGITACRLGLGASRVNHSRRLLLLHHQHLQVEQVARSTPAVVRALMHTTGGGALHQLELGAV